MKPIGVNVKDFVKSEEAEKIGESVNTEEPENLEENVNTFESVKMVVGL